MNKPSAPISPTTQFVILGILSLVWGSSFFLIKKALVAFEPEQVASLRISLSALSFLPIVLYHFRKIDWQSWRWLLVVGLTGSAVPAFLFSTAQTELSSTIAGILNSLAPFFTLVFGLLIFKVAAKRSQIGGVLLGLFGAILMTMAGEQGSAFGNLLYGLLIVGAAACYGFSANVVASRLQHMKSIHLSSASFVLVGPLGLIYLFSTDFLEVLQTHPHGKASFAAVIFLALVGTVAASVLFYWLIQKTSALFGSTVAYLMPVVSLGWGLWDGEAINHWHFIGMGLILLGVWLSKGKRRK